MGTDCFTVVVYGVVETEAMRADRMRTVSQTKRECARDPHHPVPAYRPPFVYCSVCGAAIVDIKRDVERLEMAARVYVPQGLDPDNDRDIDRIINDWVHEAGEGCDEVVLGVPLHHADARNDWGVYTATVTPEQHNKAMAYLQHLGIDLAPAIVVLVGGR